MNFPREYPAEDRGKYRLITVYDEDEDTRLRISVRFDVPDRTHFSEEIRFDQTRDLDASMADLTKEFGLKMVNPAHCTFSQAHWADHQLVEITTKKVMSFEGGRKPMCYRRNFFINLTEDMWQSGQVVSLASENRDRAWDQLREMRDLPDLTHLMVVQRRLDISQLQKWPAGSIDLSELLFAIDFKAEQVTKGWKEYRLENLTPKHSSKTQKSTRT
jgi:hypothetical protein